MQHVVDFILELDRLKGVTRKSRPIGLDRYENSAEHSWQIAMLAGAMAEFAEPGVDVHRVMQMLLVHDIGEIDTGDTIVYDDTGLAERKAAERVAVRAHLRDVAELRTARASSRCGKSSRTVKRRKRASRMRPIARCRCCSTSPMAAGVGWRTASPTNAWSARSVRRSKPDARRCGRGWRRKLEDARGRGFFGG